jgi:hypothetical protein
MDNFSQDRLMEIFGEVWGKWPSSLRIKDNKALAHQVFSQFVSNQEWLDVFETSLGDETPLVPLSAFVKNLAKKCDKPLGMVKRAVSVVESASPIQLDPISPRAQEVFQEIRAAWPVNQDHPEALSVAKKAFDLASQTRDVEDLRTACLAYCEAWFSGEITYPRPYWLKNFLGRDELIDDWISKAKYKPNLEELKVFDAVWAWYPNFTNKEKARIEKDSFEYWRRMVKSEDYFDFMVAVRAYRMERKDKTEEAEGEDQSQFTKGFVNFTKEWRDQKRYIAIVTANLLCREILDACKTYKLDPQELWKPEMNAHIQGIQKTGNGLGVEDTVGLCLKKICLLDDLLVDIEKIGKEVFSKSWERACVLPKGGLQLDSL